MLIEKYNFKVLQSNYPVFFWFYFLLIKIYQINETLTNAEINEQLHDADIKAGSFPAFELVVDAPPPVLSAPLH